MGMGDDRGRQTADSLIQRAFRRLWSAVGRYTRSWIADSRADMVWSAIVIVTVMLPLASLTIDIPRYFRLSGQLSQALETTGQGLVNTCLDMGHFEQSGQVRLVDVCLYYESGALFILNTQDLAWRGYQPLLTNFGYNPSTQRLHVEGEGTLTVFFGLTPALTIHRSVESRVRMVAQ